MFCVSAYANVDCATLATNCTPTVRVERNQVGRLVSAQVEHQCIFPDCCRCSVNHSSAVEIAGGNGTTSLFAARKIKGLWVSHTAVLCQVPRALDHRSLTPSPLTLGVSFDFDYNFTGYAFQSQPSGNFDGMEIYVAMSPNQLMAVTYSVSATWLVSVCVYDEIA